MQPRPNENAATGAETKRNRQGRESIRIVAGLVALALTASTLMQARATMLSDMLARAEASISTLGAGHGRNLEMPNPATTPGAINEDVTQATIGSTICRKGWTREIRPSAYYTNALKKKQLRDMGLPHADPRDFEEDHLIPLSLGGASRDEKNLFPQARNGAGGGASRKDELELKLVSEVCAGRLLLDDARREIAQDWQAAYRKHGGMKYRGRGD